MSEQTIDFTVTIKNIPSKEIMELWDDSIKQFIKQFGEVAPFSNNVVIDFVEAMKIHPESFYEIMAGGMTLQMISKAVKVVKE